MATGGDKSKTQSPLRNFFGSLLSTKNLNNDEDANKSSSSDRLESGNQTRRGSLPTNFPDASIPAPLNLATGTASGVIKDTGAKKKLPVVVPATDEFNLSFMPQATPQQAVQQTAPAVIGPLTPHVNNSIPTGSGTAHTGYWPGTGIYQGVQGGSGGPPDKGGNPSSQPSTNNSSDNLMATLVQVLDTKAMRFGNSFGISSNFGKMYRENRYPKHEYFGTIFIPSNLTKNRTFFVSRNLPKILPKIPKYSVYFLTTFWSKYTHKCSKMVHKSLKKWSKTEKAVFLSP